MNDQITNNNLYNDPYNDPSVNTFITKFNLKNLIDLCTVTDLYLFKKNKKSWILKDKRTLLKECEYKKKKTIKEVTSSINILKNKEIKCNDVKLKTNNLLNKVENIDSIIETIEENYPIFTDKYAEIYSNN